MKRILGLGLLLGLLCLPVLAAKNSHGFNLGDDLRVGDVQIPKGHCEVTWTEPTGSQVQLTIRTADKKTVTVPARVVEMDRPNDGVSTFVSNGVRYLSELQTKKQTFVLQEAPKENK
jgi:phenolic acid decarboxylase